MSAVGPRHSFFRSVVRSLRFLHRNVWVASFLILAAFSPVDYLRPDTVAPVPVSPAPAFPVPASFFGLTVLDFANLTPSIRFGTTRTWDAHPNLDWSDANPSAGVYNFKSLDQFIAINQARGAEIIYTFGRTPQWASSQPNIPIPYGLGQCAPPANMDNYDNYVRAIATHVAGKIKYWELWNEPQDKRFYCGDIPTMVTMARHATQIIKSIDPAALILTPAPTGGYGPAWLGSFLSAGGAPYVDVIAFHGYRSADAEDILGVVANFRSAATANNAASKPLWDTESYWSAFGNQPAPDSAQQASFIAKYYLLHWSLGVSRFILYAYDAKPDGSGLLASNGNEYPSALAYRQTYLWMVGARFSAPCSAANPGGVWICPLTRPHGYAAEVVWISNSTAQFPVPARYTEYRDLASIVHPITGKTVSIGDQPILLETAPLPPEIPSFPSRH